MRHESEQVTVHRYVSEVEPDVVATDEYCGRVIQWADEHPVVWRILKGTKSKAFGRESSFYMGFERGQSPSALLHRAVRFKRELEGAGEDGYRFETARITVDKKVVHEGPVLLGCDCGGESVDRFTVKHRRGCIIPGPHNDPLPRKIRGGRPKEKS